jgi:hypothetical protein
LRKGNGLRSRFFWENDGREIGKFEENRKRVR